MDSSPVGRAFFDGKTAQWVPMPRLQNWSGYDRDTRQALPGATVPATVPTTPEGLVLERCFDRSPDLPSDGLESSLLPPMPPGTIIKSMEWLRQQSGPVTVRDCQRNAPRTLRFNADGKTINAACLKSLFAYLHRIGEGLATDENMRFTHH